MANLRNYTQPTSGCDDRQGGIESMWIVKYADLATISTATLAGTPAAGYEINAITLASTTKLAKVVFSDNKTAFYNESAGGNAGEPVGIQASVEFEGLTSELIHWLNTLKKECAVGVFVEYKTGGIRLFGIEFIDIATGTFKKTQDPVRAKVSTASGNGGGDYEKATLELVGAAKSLAYFTDPVVVTVAYLDALKFT